MNLVYPIVALICICLIGLWMYKSTNKVDSNASKSDEPSESPSKMNLDKFKSCGCKELATWHPGQVEHKMKCQKFWKLNPGRTKEELLKTEGF